MSSENLQNKGQDYFDRNIRDEKYDEIRKEVPGLKISDSGDCELFSMSVCIAETSGNNFGNVFKSTINAALNSPVYIPENGGVNNGAFFDLYMPKTEEFLNENLGGSNNVNFKGIKNEDYSEFLEKVESGSSIVWHITVEDPRNRPTKFFTRLTRGKRNQIPKEAHATAVTRIVDKQTQGKFFEVIDLNAKTPIYIKDNDMEEIFKGNPYNIGNIKIRINPGVGHVAVNKKEKG